MSPLNKILIANRGEIASRILRTVKSLGLESVVVFHAADRHSPAVMDADEAIEIHNENPVAAYLDIDAIVSACHATSANAVHPGFGFLSENVTFVRRLVDEGITFIGPGPEEIEVMGDKITAKRLAAEAGINVLPGPFDAISDVGDARAVAEAIGYPMMLKAAAGGGGKGMRILWDESEFESAFELTVGEARASFGDGRVFLEKYIEGARHIEIQVLADGQGRIIHLGDRECSIQRRHQKVIEEAPSSFLDAATRQSMGEQAIALALAVNYRSAGTVEFVVDADRNFYFLEMNTRLQVEHPVTELVTGIDLVAEQIQIASDQPLSLVQGDVSMNGHAIECRIYAEDADEGFLPTTGQVLLFREPHGPGLRFDHGMVDGQFVSPAFDPMLGKLISHADTRELAIQRAIEALEDTVILGVVSNTDYLARILRHPAFGSGETDTNFIEQHRQELLVTPVANEQRSFVLAAAGLASRSPADKRYDLPAPLSSFGAWRN
jgi:propionyl-CoA carboxylase alpha chain